LLTLISDILELSKIEAGRLELYPNDFSVISLLKNTADLFQMRAQQKGIVFHYQPLSPIPQIVHADEKRLRKIIINLLSNAIKFTKHGGVTFKVENFDGKIRLQVEDTGVGIAPDDMAHIFKPFLQIGDPKYKAEGTEVCKQLKRDATLSEIPVIFMSAKTEKEEVIQGLELGAVDYVTKPFNSKELMTRVNTHLELKAANEKLKQFIATKDKFFAIIAHDLINLFSALLTLSSLLVKKKAQIGAEEKENFLQSIRRASQQGHDLLKNLLDWSRSQTGAIQVTPVTLNLKEIVYRNIELLDENAQTKNINIFVYIDITSVFAD
jgi:signal transduction histidine kinase